jgi:hypothetical protein
VAATVAVALLADTDVPASAPIPLSAPLAPELLALDPKNDVNPHPLFPDTLVKLPTSQKVAPPVAVESFSETFCTLTVTEDPQEMVAGVPGVDALTVNG